METNLLIKPAFSWKNLWNYRSNDPDVAIRLKARLLNKALLLFALLTLVSGTFLFYRDVILADSPNFFEPTFNYSICILSLITLYVNARGAYHTAARLILGGAYVITFIGALINFAIFLHYITVLIFAATLLSEKEVRRMMALTAVLALFMAVYKGDIYAVYNIRATMGLFLLVPGMAALWIYISHEREVEKRRLSELEHTNLELTTANLYLKESERMLEHRVQKRTEELRVAKHEAEEARDQALEADRVKSQFLANMSHELRTPLNAILNFTAFVSDGVLGDVNDEQHNALEQSISSGKHLLSLINDVLDITKIEAGLMDLFVQEVDMNEVLNATVSVGKGLVKDKPVKIITDIQPDIPASYGDKRRLRQVMLNIISNAVKFTREGSVTIKATHAADCIQISVTDTGIGIAPEDQPLVFESFKQAKHNLQDTIGTGLGMPISKYFVESHNGMITLESTPDEGTIFSIELPVLTEAEARALAAIEEKK